MIKQILITFHFLFFTSTMIFAQSTEIMLLKTDGKVIIGDTTAISTPDGYSLYVQHGILTERLKVSLASSNDWMDGAFSRTPSLEQIKQSIQDKSHLYNMPSADYLVDNGYEVQNMDAKLLEQIEWLWQYTIQISEENEKLRKEIELLKIKE